MKVTPSEGVERNVQSREVTVSTGAGLNRMRSRINYLQLNVCFWQVRIWPKSTRCISMCQYSNSL